MTSTKFKPGPAKTRDSRSAVIFEVSDKIYGKIKEHGKEHGNFWTSMTWDFEGFNKGSLQEHHDLLPNAEPLKIEYEAIMKVHKCNCQIGPMYPVRIKPSNDMNPFEGKKVRITIEEIPDE